MPLHGGASKLFLRTGHMARRYRASATRRASRERKGGAELGIFPVCSGVADSVRFFQLSVAQASSEGSFARVGDRSVRFYLDLGAQECADIIARPAPNCCYLHAAAIRGAAHQLTQQEEYLSCQRTK